MCVVVLFVKQKTGYVFFFKEKAAYGVLRSRVGLEKGIRDKSTNGPEGTALWLREGEKFGEFGGNGVGSTGHTGGPGLLLIQLAASRSAGVRLWCSCLLYQSDAAAK